MMAMRRRFATYDARKPRARRSQSLVDGFSYSVRRKATKADAKMPKEYIPEQEVEMTNVTGTLIFTGVNVRPGAVNPATEWSEFATPSHDRMELSSGASAVQE